MENKDYQKRVAAIHDLSGFGKCSLTVALPILSCRRNRSMCHADRHIIDSYRRNQRIHLPRPDKRHAGFYAALEVARYTIRCDLQRFLRFIRTTGPRQRVFRTIQIKKQPDPGRSGNGRTTENYIAYSSLSLQQA